MSYVTSIHWFRGSNPLVCIGLPLCVAIVNEILNIRILEDAILGGNEHIFASPNFTFIVIVGSPTMTLNASDALPFDSYEIGPFP